MDPHAQDAASRGRIEIVAEHASALAEYARIPIAFEVTEVLDVVAARGGLDGLRLVPRRLDAPYVKDYDADPEHAPAAWPSRFDVREWGFLAARRAGERIGGAVVAWAAAGIDLGDARGELALLWDLRVAPAARGVGVGTALFEAARRWSQARGARWLQVETQNVNARACRFYAARGCTLTAIRRFVYPAFPDEAQLLWSLRLGE